MASNRLGFKQLIKKSDGGAIVQLLLDANIIIPYFDEAHNEHDLVSQFLNVLSERCECEFFTTVIIKSEFLEYQRRRFLTEGLLDLIDVVVRGKDLSSKAKNCINSQKANLANRRKTIPNLVDVEVLDVWEEGLNKENQLATQSNFEMDFTKRYFRDSEIKKIKQAFRARTIQKEKGWLEICNIYLSDNLLEQEKILDKFCTYLTPNNESHRREYFDGKSVEWSQATKLCGSTGMGYADAMILNLFRESSLPFLVTLDFDLIYGVSLDAVDKTVVLPDSRLRNFRQPLKRT